MFVFNRDFRYVCIVYIYVCVWPYVKLYAYVHRSLLGNEIMRGPVVCNVGGVKFRPLSKA